MSEIDNPGNWGDWKPCKVCRVVQPPRALGEDCCCKDTAWCFKNRHAPKVPSNGAHKVGETASAEVPNEMLGVEEATPSKPLSACACVQPKPEASKPKSTKKKRCKDR